MKNDIAQFAYDALGRRIRKTDHVADTNNLYYYSTNWQVLCEYDGTGSILKFFVYGNYIDEVVFFHNYELSENLYYVHDHLYSPVALIHLWSDSVRERYEYDAYGNPHILNADFSEDADGLSDYDNPYYFQGKRLDMLDNGNFQLMSWPYRDYSTYLGRWLQQEKLGMIPNDNIQINSFAVHEQYADSANLYQSFASNTIRNFDIYGLLCFFTEYRELILAGGGIPHKGVIIGENLDIDYGPSFFSPLGWPGVCPFDGGVKWGSVRTWSLKIKQTGKIKYGHPDRPLCCCVTCMDVKSCIIQTCTAWTGSLYILGINDCWDFVEAVKNNCCLKRK